MRSPGPFRPASLPRWRHGLLILSTGWLFLSGAVGGKTVPAPPASRPAPGGSPVSFRRDVAPILVKRCQACHGPDKAKGEYRLDTFERLKKPGESEAAPLTPGEPGKSAIYQLVVTHDEDDRMPKKGERLSDPQVATLKRWIEQGAPYDGPDPSTPLNTLVAALGHPDPPAAYRYPVPVTAAAFSPDGKELAVGGYHEITLWDPASGELLGRVRNVAQRTQCLAYSPDGTLLAAASGTPGEVGEVRLFQRADPARVRVLERTGDMVFAARFSPDGKRLAAGGADNAVRVYDVATGRRELLIEQHADWVTDVAFSPDGRRLASASRDKSVRVFDAATGEAVAAYLGHEEPVFAAAWSEDGKRIYSAGHDRKVHVWNVADARAGEAKPVAKLEGFDGDVVRVLASGGMVFACSADGTVRQYSADKRELVRAYPKQPDWVYAVSVDEKTHRLAAGSFGGEVRVYDLRDGKTAATLSWRPRVTSRAPASVTVSPKNSDSPRRRRDRREIRRENKGCRTARGLDRHPGVRPRDPGTGKRLSYPEIPRVVELPSG